MFFKSVCENVARGRGAKKYCQKGMKVIAGNFDTRFKSLQIYNAAVSAPYSHKSVVNMLTILFP